MNKHNSTCINNAYYCRSVGCTRTGRITRLIVYTLMFLLALNFKIGSLNIFDILLLLLAMYQLIKKGGRLRFPNTLVATTVMPGIMIFSTIVIKIIFYGESTNYSGVYVLIKLTFLIIYYLVISDYQLEKVNYEIVLIMLSLPLVINILMYVVPSINALVVALYHIVPFPTNERFGGIYGDQVANLGLYAAMVVIFSVIMCKEKRIRTIHAFIAIFIAIFNVILCGTRSGMIACIAAYILLIIFEKIRRPSLNISQKDICVFMGIIAGIIVMIPVGIIMIDSFFPQEVLEKILARFSLSRFITDITVTNPNEPSNLTHALAFLDITINKCRNRSVLFGYDTIAIFNDSFYPYIFLKYGIIGLLAIAIIIIICFYKIICLRDRRILLFWFFFGAIIAIKGIFPLDSKFLFFTVFWIVYYRRTRCID